jgi:hypothetical protein
MIQVVFEGRVPYQALATVIETRRGIPERRPERPFNIEAIMICTQVD